jgi:hypothetical protein
MESDAATFRFSLAEIPQSQRQEMMREVAGRAIANLDLTPKTDDPQMEVETRVLPGLTFRAATMISRCCGAARPPGEGSCNSAASCPPMDLPLSFRAPTAWILKRMKPFRMCR